MQRNAVSCGKNLSSSLQSFFQGCRLRPGTGYPHGRTKFDANKSLSSLGSNNGRGGIVSASTSSSSTPDESMLNKINVYTAYTVYKGRGAMSLKVIKPTWERISTGSGIRVSREGTVLLEFAQGKGDRIYDWDSKGTFAMNAVECGEILEAAETSSELSFFHDPNKMGSAEGAVTKTMKFSPARDSGYFFSLYVNDKSTGASSQYTTAVSSAELRVIQQIIQFSIPRILGFDELFAGAPEVREGHFSSNTYDPYSSQFGMQPPF